ncbi:MAG: insulinase family protein, partial [Alphaproteobacteria bacterium]|nr:insulinase family protein [Alphaproteobacteria bacterium]
MVWYKAGAAEEPQGTSGIAHFLEHLMFRGSAVIEGEDLKPGEFSKIVRKLGGNDNAFTGQDYTAYFQSVPVEHLETVMRMEAGRMQGLKLTEETIETERKVILEERRQRIESDPFALLDEQISAALFVNHPYGTPVIGWMHEMEALSLKDARTFYDHWYRPDNAILVVSGDVTGARVRDLAEKIYGPI